MKLDPTAWLRAMARCQRPPATGGYIDTTTSLLPTSGGCDYTVPATAKPAGGSTLDLREPTPEDVERMAAALGVIPLGPASREQTQRIADEKAAQTRSELADRICPCVAIYSKCYYPEQHSKPLQRRP